MTRKVLQVVAGLGMCVSAAFAAQGQQYSADMVTRSSGETYSGRVFVNDDKMRYEMPKTIVITRLDLQKSYVLMPDEKMYMEQAVDPSAAAKAGVVEGQGEVERVSVGKEEVDGRMTEKFKITYTDAKGKMTVYQWLDAEELPVKVEAEDGNWSVEYQNAKRGRSPDELFEVPSDYQKFAIPIAPVMPGAGADGTLDVQKLLQEAKQEAEDADKGGDSGTDQ